MEGTQVVTLQSVLDVIKDKGFDVKDVRNVYQFGSRVYECHVIIYSYRVLIIF